MKKFIFLALALVMSLTALTSIGCVDSPKDEDTTFITAEQVQSISLFASEEETVELVDSTETELTAEMVVEEVSCIKRSVTATVLPASAPDKRVRWGLDWLYGGEAYGDVSEYVTIEATESNGLTATIKVFKPFKNASVQIVCTTIIGEVTAFCTVVYEGLPQTFTITPSHGVTSVYDEYWGVNIYEFNADNAWVTLPFTLDNIFNDVTSALTFKISEVKTFGGATFSYLSTDKNSGRQVVTGNYKFNLVAEGSTFGLDGIRGSELLSYKYRPDITEDDIINKTYTEHSIIDVAHGLKYNFGEFELSGNRILLRADKTFESIENVSGTAYSEKVLFDFHSYDAEPYFSISVIEEKSQLVTSINLRPKIVPRRVDLNSSEIII